MSFGRACGAVPCPRRGLALPMGELAAKLPERALSALRAPLPEGEASPFEDDNAGRSLQENDDKNHLYHQNHRDADDELGVLRLVPGKIHSQQAADAAA